MKTLELQAIKIEIHADSRSLGLAAANAAAKSLRSLAADRENIGVIFATGASQLATLQALTSMDDIPWQKIEGFHLDEYIGLAPTHPASFRRYLRENLTHRISMRKFHEIDGSSGDTQTICNQYVTDLIKADPQLCLLGIGENGHLAFNDPAEADFSDPLDMKVVTLDAECREQQHAEGWFPSLEAVPNQALTLTIPTIFRVPQLILSVPGPRKAQIIRRTLEESISTACPSTLLRTHSNATLYLDTDSAAELKNSALLHGQSTH
jgi:glucosamine-6-phosphate deaminase